MKNFKTIVVASFVTAAISGMNLVYADSMQNNMNTAVQKSAAYISDAAITTQVKAGFAKSKILNVFDIGVTTTDGVVFLTGTVDSDTQYEEAVSLAQSTNGVNNVNVDKFTVKDSTAPLTDIYITAKVKGAIIKASVEGKEVSILNTHVETKDGVVFLSGTLDNTQEIDNAIAITKAIDGVTDVKSSLTVSAAK